MRSGEELRYLVLAAQREGNRIFAAGVKPLGLTPAWAEVITVLSAREPLTIRELGLLLVCEGDHPSRLVKRMTAAGLLTTEAPPGDERARWLRLTPAARALLPRRSRTRRRSTDSSSSTTRPGRATPHASPR